MAEVEISYKGGTIATMNASGTKTLLTEGKYLEDDVTVEYTRPSAPSGTKNISITANGTTTEDVTNYASAQITANVPNTYSAGDEGKVVDNGALVAQGSDTVTQNDTYDTTLISSLTVNVSGGGEWTTDGIATNTEPNGAIVLGDSVTAIPDYALYNKPITSITAPKCTSLGGGYPLMNTGIVEIRPTNFPLLTTVAVNSLRMGSRLKVFHVKSLKTVNYNQLFQGNSGMQILRLPGATSNVGATNFFGSCTALKLFDAGTANNVGNIQGATNLKTLILRKTTICGLTGSSNFNNTPFKSGGTGGTIYIPKALYDHLGDGGSSDYRAATNWSTIWGYGTITWAQLEGSPYEDPDFDDTGLWS